MLGASFFCSMSSSYKKCTGLHNDASPVSRFVLIWRPSELNGAMEGKELL